MLLAKNASASAGDRRDMGQSLGREDPLEEETATDASLLAWRIPWTEEPGGLQSVGVTKSWTRLSHFTLRRQKFGEAEAPGR